MSSTTWSEWGTENLPHPLERGGGELVQEVYDNSVLTPADTATSHLLSASHARNLKSEHSPDSALALLGAECGLPQYAGESNSNYRARLNARWSIWGQCGTPGAITDTLEYIGFDRAFVVESLTGGGAPDAGIPIYPSTSEHWSQFIVIACVTGSWGTGADGWSTLLSQAQLDSVRAAVKRLKPVDWACREIVVTDGPVVYDDRSVVYWTPPNVEFAADGVSVSERFPYRRPT